MAGDWIKMRCSLMHDPKVIAIGRFIAGRPHFAEWISCNAVSEMPLCDMALRYFVTGALHVTWSVTNEHVRNGIVPGADLEWIDLVTGIDGFGAAMESVGWATVENGNLFFPKFDDNNTSSAERMRKWREKQRHKSDGNSDASRSATVTSQVTLEKRREEKRREIGTTYQSEPLSANADDAYSDDFKTFWEAFPRLRRTAKGKAWSAWKKAIRLTKPATIIAAVKEYAVSEKGRGEFVQMPATWLNGKCWQDDRAAWNPSGTRRASVVATDEDMANWNGGVQ